MYRRAVDVTENNALAHTGLAHILLERGDVEEARAHLEQALVARPGYINAHLESGRFEEAVRWQEAALQRAPASVGPEYAERLETYKAGRPFRDEPWRRLIESPRPPRCGTVATSCSAGGNRLHRSAS